MSRMLALLAGAFLVAGAGSGCCLKEKEALRPLPEEGTFAFEDLLARVRVQATTAVEAFYIDDWTELEEVAKALEQSARFLPQTTQQPAALKDLGKSAKQLRHEAAQLGEAARAKNVEAANTALQRMTLQVRLLKSKQ
jgi:hypothetical protein